MRPHTAQLHLLASVGHYLWRWSSSDIPVERTSLLQSAAEENPVMRFSACILPSKVLSHLQVHPACWLLAAVTSLMPASPVLACPRRSTVTHNSRPATSDPTLTPVRVSQAPESRAAAYS